VITDVRAGPATYDDAPATNAQVLLSMAPGDGWTLDTSTNATMVARDVSYPTCVGRFTTGTAAGRVDGTRSRAISLEGQPDVSDHRMRYATLRPDAPVLVPPDAAALGIWVYGNGAAAVDVELADAEKERWHSLHGRANYTFGMPYAGPWAFDGWRYLRFVLPPRYREGEGNRRPDKPFNLTGVVIQQYAKVLYVNHLEAPPTPTWRIGEIMWE
jgi:hypothetical protein